MGITSNCLTETFLSVEVLKTLVSTPGTRLNIAGNLTFLLVLLMLPMRVLVLVGSILFLEVG